MRKTILNFIKQFESAKHMFLNGKCYWFAVILRERFNGKLYYNPIMNHWACLINNELYDVTGMIVNTCYEPWPDCVADDTLLYHRLINQCIEFNV